MATLTTDRVAAKDGGMISVDGVLDRRHQITVAVKALRKDEPVKHIAPRPESGRQVPDLLLLIPGNGRLHQPAVALEQVGEVMRSGADGILNCFFRFGKNPALGILANLLVNNLIPTPLVLELCPLEEEGIVARCVVAL